jgi:hypothetical protein
VKIERYEAEPDANEKLRENPIASSLTRGTRLTPNMGDPDPKHISTSYVERANFCEMFQPEFCRSGPLPCGWWQETLTLVANSPTLLVGCRTGSMAFFTAQHRKTDGNGILMPVWFPAVPAMMPPQSRITESCLMIAEFQKIVDHKGAQLGHYLGPPKLGTLLFPLLSGMAHGGPRAVDIANAKKAAWSSPSCRRLWYRSPLGQLRAMI